MAARACAGVAAAGAAAALWACLLAGVPAGLGVAGAAAAAAQAAVAAAPPVAPAGEGGVARGAGVGAPPRQDQSSHLGSQLCLRLAPLTGTASHVSLRSVFTCTGEVREPTV